MCRIELRGLIPAGREFRHTARAFVAQGLGDLGPEQYRAENREHTHDGEMISTTPAAGTS